MSQIELVDEIEDVEGAEGVKPAWKPIPAEGDEEEIPDIPEDDSRVKVMKFYQERDRLRAGYPLKLSMEECLAMNLNYWPGKLYLGDTTEWEGPFSGFEPVDDPRTPGAGREVLKAIREFRTDDGARADWRRWQHSRACPLCEKCRRVLWRGTKTGFYFRGRMGWGVACPCEDLWDLLRQLERKLPPILRKHPLFHLKPSHASNLPLAVQEREIKFIQEHRNEGFLFLGPPGTSKSTFGAALLRDAIWRDISQHRQFDGTEHIWRVEGNRLLEQEQMWATAFDKDEVRRDVTPHDVVRAVRRRYKPVLFFEEIDKRRLTPFGADIYFRLIDAIDQGLGQLIVTSNLDMAGLTEMLTQADVKTTGEAILRRLGKLNIRDYWKET